MKTPSSALRASLALVLAAVLGIGSEASAKVSGIAGSGDGSPANPRTFSLVVKDAQLVTGDGNTIYAWGYADATTGVMQYPGPVLLANQNDTVAVTLTNALPVAQPVSILFPGQQGVTATCVSASSCTDGPLTKQIVPGGQVKYTFIASQPGTYRYQSGTNPSLQVDMGLIGAMVVRPTGFDAGNPAARNAYQQAGTQFDREFLFVLSEMDANLHDAVYAQVKSGQTIQYDTSTFYATMWFINGRNAPDTLVGDNAPWLPNQPYSAAPIMHPGERVLIREVSAGRDLHPFHHHGAHMLPVARDGRVLESAIGVGPDLTSADFTIRSIPGQTMDLIFEWTAKNLGWDIYGTGNGHTCNPDPVTHYDLVTHEWCPDHGKPMPVLLPNQQDVQFGEFYSGSPYLGQFGVLPQGHPGLNENGGYFHIWHSHNEKEITTNNVFPGGMKTFLIIEAPNVNIAE